MDKVPYVLIGMLIGSVLTVILMALLFASKREDESLERMFKERKERKAKVSDDVDGRVAEEPVAEVIEDFVEDGFNSIKEPIEVSNGVSDGVSDDDSSEIPKEPVEDAPNADSVDKGAKFVKVTPKSNVFVPFPGELIEWDTYFNGKHPLDT